MRHKYKIPEPSGCAKVSGIHENTRSPASFADDVARLVIQKFEEVGTGHPTVRSNGMAEWTVLAGVVVSKSGKHTAVCCLTGVKALPDEVRRYLGGTIVHDMHAEMLSLRLFNLFLLREAQKAESHFVEKTEGGYKFTGEVSLYVLEPPCGDASMTLLAGEVEAARESPGPPPKRPRTGPLAEMARGRNDFSQLGIVRTKPGRADSIPTLSKSCSDKLCVRQSIGITNAFTSALFPDGVFLSHLIVPQNRLHDEDMRRCFGRVAGTLRWWGTSVPFRFAKTEHAVPSPLALTAVGDSVEVLVNGVKNGAHRKKKPPKPPGESMVCNRRMYEAARPLLTISETTYLEFKRANTHRQAAKAELHKALGWVCTSEDDFPLGPATEKKQLDIRPTGKDQLGKTN